MYYKKSYYTIEEVFSDIIAKRGKPGLFLEGMRCREGLTQRQLADALEIGEKKVDRMEKGICKISNLTAVKLQKLFNLCDGLVECLKE